MEKKIKIRNLEKLRKKVSNLFVSFTKLFKFEKELQDIVSREPNIFGIQTIVLEANN